MTLSVEAAQGGRRGMRVQSNVSRHNRIRSLQHSLTGGNI